MNFPPERERRLLPSAWSDSLPSDPPFRPLCFLVHVPFLLVSLFLVDVRRLPRLPRLLTTFDRLPRSDRQTRRTARLLRGISDRFLMKYSRGTTKSSFVSQRHLSVFRSALLLLSSALFPENATPSDIVILVAHFSLRPGDLLFSRLFPRAIVPAANRKCVRDFGHSALRRLIGRG